MAYSFGEQKRDGNAHERVLDAYFRRFFTVVEMDHDDATVDETRRLARKGMQALGVDRLFVSLENGARYTVEYKADTTAAQTGNAFIETVSVDTRGKAGWAYTSCAQLLVYYVPPTGRALVVNLPALRTKLAAWAERYPTREIPNRGYATHGLLVPLSELEPLAFADLALSPQPRARSAA